MKELPARNLLNCSQDFVAQLMNGVERYDMKKWNDTAMNMDCSVNSTPYLK